MQKKIIFGIVAILVIGILLGFLWSFIKPVEEPLPPTSVSAVQADSFGKYFSNLFLGRPGDNSKIKASTLLVRSTKFVTGERVGLRIQAAANVVQPFGIELRFMNASTGEETPDLQKYRKKITVQPGTRSYCCVTLPKIVGEVNMGIVIGDYYVGIINGLKIVQPRQQGGLL